MSVPRSIDSPGMLAGEIPAALFDPMRPGVAFYPMLHMDGLPGDPSHLYVNPEFHRLTELGPVVGKRTGIDIVLAAKSLYICQLELFHSRPGQSLGPWHKRRGR